MDYLPLSVGLVLIILLTLWGLVLLFGAYGLGKQDNDQAHPPPKAGAELRNEA